MERKYNLNDLALMTPSLLGHCAIIWLRAFCTEKKRTASGSLLTRIWSDFSAIRL